MVQPALSHFSSSIPDNDININVYLGDVFCSGRWHEGDCDILVRC